MATWRPSVVSVARTPAPCSLADAVDDFVDAEATAGGEGQVAGLHGPDPCRATLHVTGAGRMPVMLRLLWRAAIVGLLCAACSTGPDLEPISEHWVIAHHRPLGPDGTYH